MRKCHVRGKPGHSANRCPNKSAAVVVHSGRETAIVPFEESTAVFVGAVADENDFVTVHKPRTLGDMPVMLTRTGRQSSRRGNPWAAFVECVSRDCADHEAGQPQTSAASTNQAPRHSPSCPML